MPTIDLVFTLTGSTIPRDHGYPLYRAVGRLIPQARLSGRQARRATALAIHPIDGLFEDACCVTLIPSSRLVLRLPERSLRPFLNLAGETLDVDGHRLSLGTYRIRPLRPTPVLAARLVVIDGYGEAGPFRRAIRGTFRGMGIRSTFRIQARGYLRKRKILLPGFRVVMTDLIPEDSLVIQAEGLGDFRRMGCGIFVPLALTNVE